MRVNERIRTARLGLGLSEGEVASRIGLSVHELGDLEARADEFASAIPSRLALHLCSELGLSPYELLHLRDEGESPGPLNEYIRQIRSSANLDPAQLDDRIGYEHGFIESIESGTRSLAEYPLDLAIDIADQTGTSRALMLRALQGDAETGAQ